jgi:hypothetical protein
MHTDTFQPETNEHETWGAGVEERSRGPTTQPPRFPCPAPLLGQASGLRPEGWGKCVRLTTQASQPAPPEPLYSLLVLGIEVKSMRAVFAMMNALP